MKSAVVATIVIPSLAVALAGCGRSMSTTPSTAPDAASDVLASAKDAIPGDVESVGRDTAADRVAHDAPVATDVGVDARGSATDDVKKDAGGAMGADAGVGADVAAGPDGGVRDVGRDGASDLAMGPDALRDAATTPIDGGAARSISLRKLTAYANCMPAISADPIIVVWTVDIQGAHGDSAEVTYAAITVFDDKRAVVQEFSVDKPVITLVDGAGSADQRKPVGGAASNAACEMCNGGAKYRVDLVFQIDGETVTTSASGNFSCAY
jgi:hypothetical protein